MTWRDERRLASWRGLAFEAQELSHSGGNRLQVDEFPESDAHTVGELGARPLRFRLRGWEDGDDYLDQLGNLEAAFRQHGAGELVHPWRGRYTGFVEDYEITHDTSGGVGEFEIGFIEAGLETRPTVVVVTETDVVEKGDAAATTSREVAALATYDTLPTYYRAAITAVIAAEAEDFERVVGVAADLTGVSDPLEQLDIITAAVEEVSDLLALIRFLERSGSNLPGSTGTASEDDVVATSASYITTVRTAVLSRACALAVAEEYDSADQVEDMQARLVTLIDVELDTEPADETFTALEDLRASLISALTSVTDRLPRLRTVTQLAPIPALVLAFDLYGDTAREGQILALNGSGHPGFLRGELTVVGAAEELSR